MSIGFVGSRPIALSEKQPRYAIGGGSSVLAGVNGSKNMNRTIERDLASRIGAQATDTAKEITTASGTYLILIRLADNMPLSIPTLRIDAIAPGLYVYAGSARGPGGLRARIGRHLRRGKRCHWHIDHLTEAAASLRAFPVPDGNECELVQRLIESGYYHPPIPGFGSSDCRLCVSHLLEAHQAITGEAQCQ